MALTHASLIALLACTLLSGTVFHSTTEIWNASLLRTGEFLAEIGIILVGAFFFIEVAQRNHILTSLAGLIREVSKDRIIQGILVTFPMELMVEGSSGFGTPLLIIAPLLLALHFPIELCVLLPFVNIVNGIPFGALGTPIRLGFPGSSIHLASEVSLLLLPFAWIGPFLTYGLIWMKDPESKTSPHSHWKRVLWVILLGTVFSGTSIFVAKIGPEFPALAGGFFTFVFGVISGKLFFSENHTPLHFFQHRRGIAVYGLLLITLWLGKQFWMDRLIPETHIRMFNPGLIFIFFGVVLMMIYQPKSLGESIRHSLLRSKRTLLVFFCMTFIVQQMRMNGGLEKLTSAIQDSFCGPSLLTFGVPILGWLGSILVGTSTVSNLLLSRIVDPSFYAPLAVGSAIGVQLAFQSITAMKSILNDRINEKTIFRLLAPLSLGFTLLFILFLPLISFFLQKSH